MPPYDQVARLHVSDLIEDQDQPVTVAPNESLQDVATKISMTPARAVVVVRDGRVVGILAQSDILEALGAGSAPATPVGELIQNKPPPVTIDQSITLEEVPIKSGSASTLVITDDLLHPKAVIKREALGERITQRFT